jgi:hypothetical protein
MAVIRRQRCRHLRRDDAMPTCQMLKRRAQIAAGVCVICLTFLLETTIAHRSAPHPASPIIWSVLGLVALVALALCVWYGHHDRPCADAR